MIRRFVIVCALIGLLSPMSAFAADSWVVLPMAARGLDQNTSATFVDLVASAIANKTGGVVKRARDVCLDVPCASKVGLTHRAHVAVFGQLSKLGTKVIVNLTG